MILVIGGFPSRLCQFFLLVTAVIFSGCEEWKWKSYATVEDARKEIAAGWIPPTLPPSVHAIRLTRHLDTGQAEGSFEFDPKDWSYFNNFHLAEAKASFSKGSSKAKRKAEGYLFATCYQGTFFGIIAVSPKGKGYFWTPDYD